MRLTSEMFFTENPKSFRAIQAVKLSILYTTTWGTWDRTEERAITSCLKQITIYDITPATEVCITRKDVMTDADRQSDEKLLKIRLRSSICGTRCIRQRLRQVDNCSLRHVKNISKTFWFEPERGIKVTNQYLIADAFCQTSLAINNRSLPCKVPSLGSYFRILWLQHQRQLRLHADHPACRNTRKDSRLDSKNFRTPFKQNA